MKGCYSVIVILEFSRGIPVFGGLSAL